jgi:CheY-like chemotaxis protein
LRLGKPAGARPGSKLVPADLRGMRCLVVDDNETNRKIVHYQITSWGMRNGSAEDGPTALAKLRTAYHRGEPYDLVLLDMHMPDMDGVQLARAIKADPALAPTKLVMLASISPQEQGYSLGSLDLAATLTKPVRQSQLYDCLVGIMSKEQEPSDVKSAASPGTDEIAPTARYRVLVAEDNAVNQKVARRMLEKLGYRADVVATGREAVDAVALIPYDLVLMDCQMPELDGYEATRLIRQWEEETGKGTHLPIVAMTANALAGDDQKCFAAGMDDYLSKPVKPDHLRLTLAKWFVSLAPRVNANEGVMTMNGQDAEHEPILDEEVIAGLRELQEDDGPDILAELIEMYLSDTPPRLGSLKEAIASGDANAVRELAHSVKGSSSNLGAQRMAQLCAQLEAYGKSGDLSDAGPVAQKLDAEFQKTMSALNALVAPQAGV